jgi:hypothetical protein
LKIYGDIRKSATPAANFATCTAGVVDTGGKLVTGIFLVVVYFQKFSKILAAQCAPPV